MEIDEIKDQLLREVQALRDGDDDGEDGEPDQGAPDTLSPRQQVLQQVRDLRAEQGVLGDASSVLQAGPGPGGPGIAAPQHGDGADDGPSMDEIESVFTRPSAERREDLPPFIEGVDDDETAEAARMQLMGEVMQARRAGTSLRPDEGGDPAAEEAPPEEEPRETVFERLRDDEGLQAAEQELAGRPFTEQMARLRSVPALGEVLSEEIRRRSERQPADGQPDDGQPDDGQRGTSEGLTREEFEALPREEQVQYLERHGRRYEADARFIDPTEDVDPAEQARAEFREEHPWLSAATDIALALQPGSAENQRMLEAIGTGFQQSLEQMRMSASASRLIRARTVDDPDTPAVAPPPMAEAQWLNMTEEERLEEAQRLSESYARLQALGQPESVRRAQEAGTIFGAIREAAADPTVAIPQLAAGSALQSAPATAGAILGAAGGPVGSAVGQFVGTLAVEEQAAISNLLAESGVDLSNPTDILAATADPEKRREIQQRALRRGLAVGTVDGLFGAATVGLHRVGLSPIISGTAGFGVEIAGEGAGEAAGQVAAGEEFDPAEVGMEMVAALGQSGAISTGTLAAGQLLPSEQRLQNEIQRQLESGEATLEALPSDPAPRAMRQLMQEAIEAGGLESPEQAARRAIEQAISRGEITVEPIEGVPTESAPTEEAETLPTPERSPEADIEATEEGRREAETEPTEEPAEPEMTPEALHERLEVEFEEREATSSLDRGTGSFTLRAFDPERDPGDRPEVEPANEIGRITGDVTDDAVRVRTADVLPDFRGQGFGTRLYQEIANQAFEAGKKLESDRVVSPEAARVYRALERRGFEVYENPDAEVEDDGHLVSASGDPVFTVRPPGGTLPGETRSQREPTGKAERLEAMGLDDIDPTGLSIEDVAELENQVGLLSEMSEEDLRQQAETFRAFDRPRAQAIVRLTEQELAEREAAGEEARAETEPPETGASAPEEVQAFRRDVAQAPPELLQAAAAHPELTAEEADIIRTEVQQRQQDDAIQEQDATAILSALQGGAREGTEEVSAERGDRGVPEGERQRGEQPEGEPVEEQPDVGPGERIDPETGEVWPAAAPTREELTPGAVFVDVSGDRPRRVEVKSEPRTRLVEVEIADATHGSFTTSKLIRHLRRPGEVEPEMAQRGSVFPEAEVGPDGTAQLDEQFRIVPEDAIIPDAAEVRHDLTTSDLPVARIAAEVAAEQEAEQQAEREGPTLEPAQGERDVDITQMGRRQPIRQEERIQQQVEQVEAELQQARKTLRDLKSRRPEQERQEEAEQESLFPTEQEQEPQQEAEQPSLGTEFERSEETTEVLQRMIDEQEAVVDRLQQQLIDLRQQAPEAASQARRAQTDLEEEIQRETTTSRPPLSDEAPAGSAPDRSAADVLSGPAVQLSSEEVRGRRRAAIEADLYRMLHQGREREPLIQRTIEDISRTVDRVRELRASVERDVAVSADAEADAARLMDYIDELMTEIEEPLSSAEQEALQRRIRGWTTDTTVPGEPIRAHLNTDRPGAYPAYQHDDGYAVQMDTDGTITVVSPQTGRPIDRRSSRYDDVIVDFFQDNSEAIDQAPRVTDQNPEITLQEWTRTVAHSTQNPFELIEAILVAQEEEVFDPVAMRLSEVGRLSTSSVSRYVSSGEIMERNAGNWVHPDGAEIEQVAADIERDFGIEISPQEIIEEYVLQTPGGPSQVGNNGVIDRLLESFEGLTGVRLTPELADRIYRATYDAPTGQQQGDRGTAAPFEPQAPYFPRHASRRSNMVRQREGGLGRRPGDDPRGSQPSDVADSYELREGEPEEMRDVTFSVMEQLELFGPPTGEQPVESEVRRSPPAIDQRFEVVAPEQRQRIEGRLLGRGITDDLHDNHAASLIGRTVTSPDDLAALAQVYRDPRVETFRYFFVRDREDGSQEIVHQTGVSTRLPGAAPAFPVESEGFGEQVEEVPERADVEIIESQKWESFGNLHQWMAHIMDETGADGYYLLHNHPSGRVEPSKQDINLTGNIAFDTPGFRGHVIIDSGKYGVIEVDSEQLMEHRNAFVEMTTLDIPADLRRGARRENIRKTEFTVHRRPLSSIEQMERANIDPETGRDRLLSPSIKHPALGVPVQSVTDLKTVARTLQDDTDAPIIVALSMGGKVRAIMEADAELLATGTLREVHEEVLAFARHSGAGRVFVTNVSSEMENAMTRWVMRGIFDDYVTTGGRSARANGVRPGSTARQNYYGMPDESFESVRVAERRAPYGDQLRSEVRRRVGTLRHDSEAQADPDPESGPVQAEDEQIRQAAIRVGDELYTGMTHAHAVQAALDDGALTEEDGEIVTPGGTPIGAETADVNLDLFTTSRGRVVSRREAAETRGVARADQIERTPEQERRGFDPPPQMREISRSLVRRMQDMSADERRAVDVRQVSEDVNSVEYTLENETVLRSEATEDIQTSMNDATINQGNPVSAPEVIKSFINVVRQAGREVPYRYGHYRGFSQGTLGVFKVEPEVVRLKQANDIPVAAHEMGHALEKAVFGWVDGSPWVQAVAGTDGAVQDELVQLGRDLYGDQSPKGGYKREGWAEFITYYLLTDEAETRAPQLHAWFTEEFLPSHPAVAEALETARDKARQWYDQGAIKRARSSVQKKRSFWQNLKESVMTPEGRRRLQTQASRLTLTEFSPFLRLVEEAEARLGESLPVDENPFLTAEALAKTHTARTRMFVEQGTFDFAGNPTGPPLRDAAQIVRGQREEFTLYLWARRALKLWEGRPAKWDEDGNLIQTEKPPRNPGISKEDARYIFDYYDSLDFRRAAEMVYAWNDRVLDYTKAAWDESMAEQIKGGDVGDYIPLQRVFDDLNQSAVEARQSAQTGGGVLGSDPVNALKGSSRRIRDPFQTMIEQAEGLIRATHEKYLLNQLVTLAQNVEGLGRFIEQVPRDVVPQQINAQAVIEDLRRRGLDIEVPWDEVEQRANIILQQQEVGTRPSQSEREAVIEQAREELIQEKMGQFMTFFKPAIVPEGSQDPIVAIQNEEGEIQWYELSGELYKAFQGLDIYRLPWYLDYIFGVPARTFRLGTTGIRASFALITNPARDLPTLFAQSRSSQNPGSMFAEWAQAMRAGFDYTVTDDIEADPHFARFMRLGGEIARPLGVDTEETRRAVRELFQPRSVRILNPRNYIDHMRDVFQIPESATRVAELKARAEEIGWEPGTQMSDGQALQLLLDAKRVTTDFTSQGQATKVLNQVIPFTTATIGGHRAFVRAFQQNPKRAIAAAATIATATLGYWWQIKDEEWYKELRPRERFNNWIFPLWEDGPVLVYPRPHEWGTLWSAIPEALADAWYREEPEQVEEVIGHMYQNLNPLDLPTFINVGAEQLANQQFYWDRPIVPMSEQRKPAAEQFGPYTSTVAIQVGRAFGVSPRRIDHLIAGLLGGVGRDATSAMDALLSTLGLEGTSPAVEREQTEADLPVVGRLFRPGRAAGTGGRSIDAFYELLEEKQMIQASDVRQETEEDRQTRLMLQDAQKALSLLFWLRRNTPEAEPSRRLIEAANRLARDAIETAESGLVEVARKRAQLRSLRTLERERQAIGPETMGPALQQQIEQLGLDEPRE